MRILLAALLTCGSICAMNSNYHIQSAQPYFGAMNQYPIQNPQPYFGAMNPNYYHIQSAQPYFGAMNPNYYSVQTSQPSFLEQAQMESRKELEDFKGEKHRISVEGVPEELFCVILADKKVFSCPEEVNDTISDFYFSPCAYFDKEVAFRLDGRNPVDTNISIISRAFGKPVCQVTYNKNKNTGPRLSNFEMDC